MIASAQNRSIERLATSLLGNLMGNRNTFNWKRTPQRRSATILLAATLLLSYLISLSQHCLADDEIKAGENDPKVEDTNVIPRQMKLPAEGPFRLETKFYDVLAPLQYTKREGITDNKTLETGLTKLGSGTNSNILRGYLQSDQLQSTLTTLQRKPLARLQNNLIMMQAKTDPNLDNQFAVQLARSRSYVDFLKAQMRAELAKVKPMTPLPDFSQELSKAQAPLTLNSSRISEEIEQERRKAKLILGHERDRVTIVKNVPIPEDFDVSKANGASDTLDDFYMMRRGKRMLNRDLPSVAFQLDSPAPLQGKHAQPQILQELQFERNTARQIIETERAKMRRQIDADLRGNPSTAGAQVDKQLAGELARARQMQSQEARRVRGELDAIMTVIRPNPASDQELIGKIGSPSGQILSWDDWYARFTRAYEPQLIRAFRKHRDPSGSNTVSITVKSDLSLRATVYQKSPQRYDNFDRATVEAYGTLNGNSILKFPAGSRRKQITFLIDNKHASSNPINGVESMPYSGDKEVLQNPVKQ